jgi:hypothetical protein
VTAEPEHQKLVDGPEGRPFAATTYVFSLYRVVIAFNARVPRSDHSPFGVDRYESNRHTQRRRAIGRLQTPLSPSPHSDVAHALAYPKDRHDKATGFTANHMFRVSVTEGGSFPVATTREIVIFLHGTIGLADRRSRTRLHFAAWTSWRECTARRQRTCETPAAAAHSFAKRGDRAHIYCGLAHNVVTDCSGPSDWIRPRGRLRWRPENP